MPVRDHQGLALTAFNGLWARGDEDTVPLDHFSDCDNIDFVAQSSFKTRPGINISQTTLVPLSNVKRIYNYPTQTANTLIVLTYDNDLQVGNIYHVVDANTVYGPILSVPGMTDFAFVAYAGRGYISPFSYSQPLLNPPNGLAAAIAQGAGVDVGKHDYAVSFLTSSGETDTSAITSVTTIGQLPDPVVTPVITDTGVNGTNKLTPGATYKWLTTYVKNGLETNIGPVSLGFVAPASNHSIGMSINIQTAIPVGAVLYIYRTLANGSVYYREYAGNITTFIVAGVNYIFVGGDFTDAVLVTHPVAPAVNSTQEQKVNLNSIPTSRLPDITARKLWRTKANDSQLKLLNIINDNITTSYVDTAADSTLGINAPTINTAFTGINLIEKGINGQFLYVYAGDGTPARKAAGAGMSGVMTVANGVDGHTDFGQHIFGFVSQSISGYNSPPTILTPFITSANNSVSFGNIPTSGDPNTVKRLLVASKAISTYNGDPSGYELFFVPNGIINNNTDTFLNNISFYDAELLADATYLLDNYTSIPAGAVLTLYHNRLCIGATATDISLLLVSQVGEPEAINQLSGLIIVPLDGNPITNAQELREVLYVFKRAKTIGYADNGGEPSSWPDTVIDNAIGTSVHGIATVLDSGAASVDFLIVCSYGGIIQFNGRYVTPELSYKIEEFWKALDRNKFGNIQIINAPIQKTIFAVLPTRQILIGNYSNGMDWKSIRWTPWSIRTGVNTVAIHGIDEIVFGADIF